MKHLNLNEVFPFAASPIPSGGTTPPLVPWYDNLATLLEASVFEHAYAEASGITVRELRLSGRFPEPCANCDYKVCHGWKMGHQWEDAIVDDLMWEGE